MFEKYRLTRSMPLAVWKNCRSEYRMEVWDAGKIFLGKEEGNYIKSEIGEELVLIPSSAVALLGEQMMKVFQLDKTQDIYTPEPGTHTDQEEIFCGVCGEKMTVRRNVSGPRCFAQAMSHSKSVYDLYSCPNREQDWHEQVVEIRKEAIRIPSMRLAEIMLEEVDVILATKKKTK